MVQKEAFDAAEDDPLINPAHVLVGTRARDVGIANAFVDWLVSPGGGQKVIAEFAVNDVVLHSPAPHGVSGFEQWEQEN
jgi:ABC-type tungstate transport system permease subunit